MDFYPQLPPNLGERFFLVATPDLVYILGGYLNNTLNRVLTVSKSSESVELPGMLTGRADFTATLHQTELFVVGGYSEENEQVLSLAEVFVIPQRRWVALPSLNTPRRWAASAHSTEALYVMGGKDVDTVERLDIEAGVWEFLSIQLEVPVVQSLAYPLESAVILLLGGRGQDGESLRNVFGIDITGGSIVPFEPMDEPLAASSMPFWFDRCLHLFDGVNKYTYNCYHMNYQERFISRRGSTYTTATTVIHERVESQTSIILTKPVSVLVIKKLETKPETLAAFYTILQYLEDKEATVFVEANLQVKLPKTVNQFTGTNQIDLVITIGGDGTIVWAAGFFKSSPMPALVPFHIDSPGFADSYHFNDHCAVLDPLFTYTSVTANLLFRLNCYVISGEESVEWCQAVNDISVDRGNKTSMLSLDVYVNGDFCTTANGDGVIVSTPYGSSAYSLAAGGSIVHPSVPAFLLTPICPHSLSFRPVIFPNSATVVIEVSPNCRIPAWVGVDGHTRVKLDKGHRLEISLSEYPVKCKE